jgi:hypothetical protein
MGSLPRLLEYDSKREFDAFPSDSEITEIVTTAEKYLERGEALRASIRQAAKQRCDEAISLPAFLKHHMNNNAFESGRLPPRVAAAACS